MRMKGIVTHNGKTNLFLTVSFVYLTRDFVSLKARQDSITIPFECT